MIYLANIILITAMVILSVQRVRPIILALVYTAGIIALRLIFVDDFHLLDISKYVVLKFLYSWLYFWLLHRFRGRWYWWIIAVGGFLFGIV